MQCHSTGRSRVHRRIARLVSSKPPSASLKTGLSLTIISGGTSGRDDDVALAGDKRA